MTDVILDRQHRIPALCERPGCPRLVETWCPLCEKFYCLEHDQLTPVPRHTCLRGPAEAA